MGFNKAALGIAGVFFCIIILVQVRAKPADEHVVVKRVVDGDTVVVVLAGKEQKVRFVGVNTPELKSHECGAEEARVALQKRVDGKVIVLKKDAKYGKDEYGRLLRYVHDGNGDVNAWLVQQGFARMYIIYPFARQRSYEKLEKEARLAKRGLWGVCNLSVSS